MTLQLEIDDSLTRQLSDEAIKQNMSIEELLVTFAREHPERKRSFD